MDEELYYDIDYILEYIVDWFERKPNSWRITPYCIVYPEIYWNLTNKQINEKWEKVVLTTVIPDILEINEKWEELKKHIDSYFISEEKRNNTSYVEFFEIKIYKDLIKNIAIDFKKYIDNLWETLEVEEINNEISKTFKGRTWYLTPWYYSPKQLNKSADILFVWMNPAWEHKNKKWEIIYNKIKTEVLEEDKADVIKAHDTFFEYSTFFAPFEKMFWHFYNGRWNHIDVFPVRGTNQEEIVIDIEENKEFFFEQYKIFIELVNILEPKIIVVSNAWASNYLKRIWKWKNDKWELDRGMYDKENWYWITPSEWVFDKQYPLIFTGMLSWQRALDLWSRDILQFHIENILEQLDSDS